MWMSLIIIILCERSQTPPKKYILYDFLYIKLKKMQTNLLWLKQVSDCLCISGVREEHKETYGEDGYIHHHGYDYFMGAYICQNLFDCDI